MYQEYQSREMSSLVLVYLHNKPVFTYTKKQFLLTQQTSFYLHNKTVFTYTTNQFLLTQQTSFYLHNKPVFTNTTNQFLLAQQTRFYLHNNPAKNYVTYVHKKKINYILDKFQISVHTYIRWQCFPSPPSLH